MTGRARCGWIGLVAGLACAFLGVVAAAAEPESPFRHGQWPFVPLTRPALPAAATDPWCRNLVDAYVVEALGRAGLRPSPAAGPLALLRRVTFDLTGLPPTPREQAEFLADPSPEGYARVVDRLLGSPAYGERWAQHWLDLVRYAESDGFKEDALRPQAFRYRDYVIQAFNADLPYDRFLSQQLAGDELEPDNPAALVATGFLRLYPDEYNAANVRQRRQEILDDITDTTSVALLGLTMGCARCHDHKFDEVLQTDYYRLQAFFAALLPRDDVLLASAAERQAYEARLEEWRQASAEVRRQIDDLLAPHLRQLQSDALEKFDAEIRAAVETAAAARSPLQHQLAAQAMKYVEAKTRGAAGQLQGDDKLRYAALQRELAALDALRPVELPRAMAVSDASGVPPATYFLHGGSYQRPGDQVQPGFPAFLSGAAAAVPEPAAGQHSSGRRSALARWLSRGDHPLTSRLIANRLWQFHFGEGIVGTANDFGAMGDAPSHPELLDALACRLVDSGWSLKQLHRLLVTSAAYGQTSLVDPRRAEQARALAADPENRLLWRARRRRLEGESIRDAMLHVSGQLQRPMFGPSVRPELPPALRGPQSWQPEPQLAERHRRSVYLLVKRNLRYPLLEAFDQPDLHHSCARRARTTTAPQALVLLNGELARGLAGNWADRLLQEHGSDRGALVAAAYREAFGRPPRPDELAAGEEFLAAQSAPDAAGDPRGAAMDLCLVLFNANEFLYVD